MGHSTKTLEQGCHIQFFQVCWSHTLYSLTMCVGPSVCLLSWQLEPGSMFNDAQPNYCIWALGEASLLPILVEILVLGRIFRETNPLRCKWTMWKVNKFTMLIVVVRMPHTVSQEEAWIIIFLVSVCRRGYSSRAAVPHASWPWITVHCGLYLYFRVQPTPTSRIVAKLPSTPDKWILCICILLNL